MPGSKNELDFLTRAVDLGRDQEALRQLDISFKSDQIFHVNARADALTLSAVTTAVPVAKQFPLVLNAAPWTDGWVIEERGRLLGFIGCGHSEWNRRLVIWHFYVDNAERRWGFGRLLMECALTRGREWAAKTAWVETSNLNYPGIVAYQHLGFEICGFDITLYRGTADEGEFAVFLARNL